MSTTAVSDSYITTIEEADAFFAARLDSASWDDADAADQAKALQMATARLDNLDYKGYKYLQSQERQFPRKYSVDPFYESPWGISLSLDAYGYAYESDVPQRIKDACCLEAAALLEYYSSTDPINEQDLVEAGVKSFSLGKLSMSLSKTSAASRNLRSAEAYELISRYLDNGGFIV